jgi:hypothetical protein
MIQNIKYKVQKASLIGSGFLAISPTSTSLPQILRPEADGSNPTVERTLASFASIQLKDFNF